MRAAFCGGFVTQWFMAVLVRHPGFLHLPFLCFSPFSHAEQAEFHLNLHTTSSFFNLLRHRRRNRGGGGGSCPPEHFKGGHCPHNI